MISDLVSFVLSPLQMHHPNRDSDRPSGSQTFFEASLYNVRVAGIHEYGKQILRQALEVPES